MKNLFLGFLALLLMSSIPAHPLKQSVAQLKYNSNDKQVELLFNLFADDFGAHIQQTYGLSGVDFSTEDPELVKHVSTYILEKFKLKMNSKDVNFSFLSMKFESSKNIVRVKFSTPFKRKTKISTISIKNTLLFEAFEDQENVVHINLQPELGLVSWRFSHEKPKTEEKIEFLLK